MDEVLLLLAREGFLHPQSPDEDMASRLILQSVQSLRSARKLKDSDPHGCALFCYLALFHISRARISAKGYRASSRDPHAAVKKLIGHWLNGPRPDHLRVVEELRELWSTLIEEPDMPIPRFSANSVFQKTRRLVRLLSRQLTAEFPAFKKLIGSPNSPLRSVSPERSFRD